MKKFKKTNLRDRETSQLQENIEQVLLPITQSAIINGVIIKDQLITTGTPLDISHKLGRTPIGYKVIKRNANSVVWDSNIDSRTIQLNSSATVTISLWIF